MGRVVKQGSPLGFTDRRKIEPPPPKPVLMAMGVADPVIHTEEPETPQAVVKKAKTTKKPAAKRITK